MSLILCTLKQYANLLKIELVKSIGSPILSWLLIMEFQKIFTNNPYHCCHKTTRLISENIKTSIPIMTTFQSRFGPQEWLQPYTDKTLEKLPKEDKKNILVICLFCF